MPSKIKEFKKFLADECWDEEAYGDGDYDQKIFSWFSQLLKEKEKEVREEIIEAVHEFMSEDPDVFMEFIHSLKSK